MLIVQVSIHVKPDALDAFIAATLENVRQSALEPGIARFDFIQEQSDPTRFQLTEVYRSPDAPARHKETTHYHLWRDTVEDMMASPRESVKFENLFPDDEDW
jgi:quinol monooxygenase YgiN